MDQGNHNNMLLNIIVIYSNCNITISDWNLTEKNRKRNTLNIRNLYLNTLFKLILILELHRNPYLN